MPANGHEFQYASFLNVPQRNMNQLGGRFRTFKPDRRGATIGPRVNANGRDAKVTTIEAGILRSRG